MFHVSNNTVGNSGNAKSKVNFWHLCTFMYYYNMICVKHYSNTAQLKSLYFPPLASESTDRRLAVLTTETSVPFEKIDKVTLNFVRFSLRCTRVYISFDRENIC